MKRKFNWTAVVAIVLVVVFLGSYVISFFNSKRLSDREEEEEGTSIVNDADTGSGNTSDTGTAFTEPPFVKQGELNFLSKADRKVIKKINIEVADNDQKRTQGLMYRKSMKEDNGMLFIFDTPEPKNFWMHNTYISLDIIYVSEDRQIVTIARNCKTLSDENIPSGKDAQYVIEVNAGWCDKNGVKEGDFVSF